MNSITIKGQLRSEIGKKSSRRLRAEGKVPGVIYGGKETIHFYSEPLELRGIVYTNQFLLGNIEIEGSGNYRCILKDLQFDKITDKIIHIDFLELVENKKVIATIPLKFTGTSKGVKEGGRFVEKVNKLNVRTLPNDLREFIEVDITELTIGKNLRVSDINYPEAEIMHSPRIPIAGVVITRQLKQAAAEEAKKAKSGK